MLSPNTAICFHNTSDSITLECLHYIIMGSSVNIISFTSKQIVYTAALG